MDSHTELETGFCILNRDHAAEPQSRSLEALSGASAYNDWIFSVFAEFIGNRTLEIGCGTGNLTRHLLENAKEVTAIDINDEYLRVMSRTVRVPEGHALTVRNQNFLEDMTNLAGFDTIVLINVLEHLAEPEEALRRIYEALMPSGRVIVLVPAFNFLFSRFDELIGHHRRYTLRTLASELTSAGFSIKKNVYFNFFGMAGWWWRFCVLKKEYLTTHAVWFFEALTPLLRAVESAVRLPVGLSVIAIGEKPLGKGAVCSDSNDSRRRPNAPLRTKSSSNRASTNMNLNSGCNGSNGSKKKLNHSISNSFPLSGFHHQFLEIASAISLNLV